MHDVVRMQEQVRRYIMLKERCAECYRRLHGDWQQDWRVDKGWNWGEKLIESALTTTSFGIFLTDIWREKLIMWSADSPYRNGYRERKHVPRDGGWVLHYLVFDRGSIITFPVTPAECGVRFLHCESCCLTCHHHTDIISSFLFPIGHGIPRFVWLQEKTAVYGKLTKVHTFFSFIEESLVQPLVCFTVHVQAWRKVWRIM